MTQGKADVFPVRRISSLRQMLAGDIAKRQRGHAPKALRGVARQGHS